MIWKSIFRTISVFLLMTVVVSCTNAGATSTSEPSLPLATQGSMPTETPAAEATAITDAPPATESPVNPGAGMPAMGSGQCANAYYPVRNGATWTYASTGSPAGNYSFTDTITSVTDAGFTLTTQFNELSRTQEWGCNAEGLVALELGGVSAATISTSGAQMSLDVTNISGITYPNTIAQGDQWQHDLEFTGNMSIAGQEGEASGTAQSSFSALGMESVTVPAGTFDAMKIEINTTVTIGVSFQGMKLPVTFTSSYMYWFVQGVGWVKASGTGDIGGQTFTETIELQSYSIP